VLGQLVDRHVHGERHSHGTRVVGSAQLELVRQQPHHLGQGNAARQGRRREDAPIIA